MNDPVQEFKKHWQQALDQKDPVADALYLATVDADGKPHVRTVLLKQVPDGRFGFVTKQGGEKNNHLARCNDVECCTNWPTLGLQVRLRATTEKMDKVSLGFLWQLRPRDAQIVYSMELEQSQKVESFEFLEGLFARLQQQFQKVKAIPLSKFYLGYFLRPYQIEFLWHQQSRLNRRELYRLEKKIWQHSTLTP